MFYNRFLSFPFSCSSFLSFTTTNTPVRFNEAFPSFNI